MWLLCVLWHVCVNEANHLYSGICRAGVWEADWDVKMIWDGSAVQGLDGLHVAVRFRKFGTDWPVGPEWDMPGSAEGWGC
jgi:hypothetical protein